MKLSILASGIPMNFKFWISWLLVTATASVFISLAQMYSREETLDNVRKTDFEIIYAALQLDASDQNVIFSKVTQKLIRSSKDRETGLTNNNALFQLALLNNTSCIDNGQKYESQKLCDHFPTLQAWADKSTLDEKTSAERNAKYPYQYAHFNGDTYLFKSVKNGSFLIGKAGDYAKSNPFRNTPLTFTKRVTNYIFGTWNGVSTFLYKTGITSNFIFLISFIATLLWKITSHQLQEKHQRAISELQKGIEDKDDEWNELLNSNSQIKQNLRAKDIEIKNLKLKMEEEKEASESNSEYLVNQAIELEKERDMIFDELIQTQTKMTLVEKENEVLQKDKETQAQKLAHPKLIQEYKAISDQINDIKRLWRSRTNWPDRLKIEENASPNKTRIPFTLSTAFITFERHIDKLYEDMFSPSPQERRATLDEKIDLLWKNNPNQKNRAHRIRIARNKWFHKSELPREEIINELIEEIINEDAPL